MPVSDGRSNKTFEQLPENPDLSDQFAIPYPLGRDFKVPAENQDPGRIRNEAFFVKMYGDCRKREVENRLKPLDWFKDQGGSMLRVTSINGVDVRLAAVARELGSLPKDMARFLVPSAGT